MSKEELLKYLIAEIDLIMHDKDYRFENANGTWYSRESCRDLTNEEVFEELRTELRQFADLETKLAESEKKAYSRGHSQRDIANEIKLNALREDVANKEKRIVELKQQLAESEKSKESYRLQNEHHHLQLLQFYSRLGVEAFGADIHEKALETLMIMKEELEEKNGVERALSACNRQNDEFSDMIKKLVNEKEELKQQLAEKDKEIENNKKSMNIAIKFYSDEFVEKDKELKELRYKVGKAHQDKISFAVEQLEKVKEHNDNLICDDEDYYNYITAFIDNQIEELKKEMK